MSASRALCVFSHIFVLNCIYIALHIFFYAFVDTDPRNVVELLMRRPSKDKYRLDRLLERKAKEGVKIYIIL